VIAKNPGSKLRELMNCLANHVWHVLQCGCEDLLSIAMEGDKGSNEGDVGSMPRIYSPHSKKTNKRLKRFTEQE
jgi:hypothetical protein